MTGRRVPCCRCERLTDRPVLVGVVESGSGPGGMLYACPDHARWFATLPHAPQWLRDELHARQAAEPYRSVSCRLGQHPACRHADPPDPGPPCDGVTVLTCTCPCHHRDDGA
ncbi:hypothetical protein ACFSJS_03380 [Streptomyces desertarenae]|uniref:4Fe-4S Wbl-type domain-containing protein n=1 Tax=Streptomyces desertarenae TaxID=2666184 RepID=A0ABW4PEF4_9ACTN